MILFYICVCICVYMNLYAHVCRCLQKLQDLVSPAAVDTGGCESWYARNWIYISSWAESVLNCWDTFQHLILLCNTFKMVKCFEWLLYIKVSFILGIKQLGLRGKYCIWCAKIWHCFLCLCSWRTLTFSIFRTLLFWHYDLS